MGYLSSMLILFTLLLSAKPTDFKPELYRQKLNQLGSFHAIYTLENISEEGNVIPGKKLQFELIRNETDHFILAKSIQEGAGVVYLLFDSSQITDFKTGFQISMISPGEKTYLKMSSPVIDQRDLPGLYVAILEQLTERRYRKAFIKEWGLWYGLHLQMLINHEGLKFDAKSIRAGNRLTGSWLGDDLLKTVTEKKVKKELVFLKGAGYELEIDRKSGLLKRYRYYPKGKKGSKQMRLHALKQLKTVKKYDQLIPDFKEMHFKTTPNPALITPFMSDYIPYLLTKVNQNIDIKGNKVIQKLAREGGKRYLLKWIPKNERNLKNFNLKIDKELKRIEATLGHNQKKTYQKLNKLITPWILEGMKSVNK